MCGNMGKNKSKSNDKKCDRSEEIMSISHSSKASKSPKPQPINERLSAVIKSVGLPDADGLTAEQLTENQKHVLKKVCAKMYGHQHTEKTKMPAKSLESATAQLAEKMKAQLAQRKKEKKKLKQKQNCSN